MMDFTGWGDVRITTLREFVRAFYEAALEDELTWSADEAWALAKLALSDYLRRHPDCFSVASSHGTA